ncbi:MAG: hypothetical protein R2788_21905 [Saprospiraceae bacterium]
MPFAYRLTNNYEDAKDLIQETAMRAFNNKERNLKRASLPCMGNDHHAQHVYQYLP